MHKEVYIVPHKNSTPQHVAIIMDGNGRWADKLGLPKQAGHKRGAEVAKQVTLDAKKLGLKYITLYAFSSENWNRSPEEVSELMNLLRNYLKSSTKDLMKEGVRIRFIGRRHMLAQDIQDMMESVEKESAHHDFTLVLAISYGSRDEIRDAAVKLAQQAIATGSVNPYDFEHHLDTYGIPDPDLFIRTSGELRISNYLLWQLAYTELFFTPVLWPDFNELHIVEALEEFSKRDRRYGGRNA